MLSDPKYLPYLLRNYHYWDLFLHDRQLPYVGRCYAWWKDQEPGQGEGMRFADLNEEALAELGAIEDHIMTACAALGHKTEPYSKKFLLNLCYLANDGKSHNHHMHFHFIPRFKEPLAIPGLAWVATDTEWGREHLRSSKEDPRIPAAQTEHIRKIMAKAIKSADR